MNDMIKEEEKSYYERLKHYKPMCYTGVGVPFLLVHDTYWTSMPCLIFSNVVYILAIVLTYLTAKKSKEEENKYIMVNLLILSLVFIDISYFLTVFMNPGIVSEQHMLQKCSGDGFKFCEKCNRRTKDMDHCRDCEVCVQDLDHHCGFFGKCIAGAQRFAFYGFIFFMFCGFLLLLVAVSLNLQ